MRKLVTIALAAAALVTGSVALTTATAQAAAPHTQKIVVRPVHRNGTPVRGYKVVTENHGSDLTCGGDDYSAVAVDNGIGQCGGTADALAACWKSTHHTALCLRDPRVKKLVRVKYKSFATTTKIKHPAPLTLAARSSSHRFYCTVRIGGAWSPLKSHPSWYGDFYCNSGLIYGPGSEPFGVNTLVNPWAAHVFHHAGQPNESSEIVRISQVYYVGTAA